MSLLRLLLICFVLWDTYAIWSDLMYHFFIHIIGWRLSVSINDMLCYVMLFWRQLLNVSSQWWHRRTNCWNKSNFMKIDWYITVIKNKKDDVCLKHNVDKPDVMMCPQVVVRRRVFSAVEWGQFMWHQDHASFSIIPTVFRLQILSET